MPVRARGSVMSGRGCVDGKGGSGDRKGGEGGMCAGLLQDMRVKVVRHVIESWRR